LEQLTLKVDAKGRICIPADIREQIGNTATLRKTAEGYLLLPGKQKDIFQELKQKITSEHKRTGTPENWSPEKIKKIWSKT